VARALIVGGSVRGRALVAALVADGLAVRAIAEEPAELAAISAAGGEPVLADPGRIGTLMDALSGVTVVCWLMGTAGASPERGAELHGDRLRMLFEKLVDTPVRGVVYEAAGTLPPEVYARGREIASTAARTWALPVEILTCDPVVLDTWRPAARACVARLLTTRGRPGR
jgi:hypothetical protein